MRALGPRLAAGVIAASLLLGGCGPNPAPRSLPKPSTSPSPSSSTAPAATPPVLPAAARLKTKAGAIAFARHYVDLINFAQATGRLDGLRAVEEASCKSCAKAESYLRDLYGHGGALHGGAFKVRSASALMNPATRGWLVEVGVLFGPQRVDHPSPTPDETPQGGRLPINVQVAWRSKGWRVLEWTRGA